MNSFLVEIDKNGTKVLESNEEIYLKELSGFVFAMISSRPKFRGIVQFEPTDAGNVISKFSNIIKEWETKYKTNFDGFSLKYLAPRGMESVVEGVLNCRKFDFHGRYVGRDDQLELIFQGGDGRFRVSGLGASTDHIISNRRARSSKVLIVDDSKTIRQLLNTMISGFPGFEVVGMADKPSQVEGLIKSAKPDIMTLDLNMPEMSGNDLLKEIFPKYHIPTLIVSSVNATQGTKVIDALEIGAIDYVYKTDLAHLGQMAIELEEKLIVAAEEAFDDRIKSRKENSVLERSRSKKEVADIAGSGTIDLSKVIVIGASTGGTEAIRVVLESLPSTMPPILITQHIPAFFSAAFAKRLDSLTDFKVWEAQDGDIVGPGEIVVAAGDTQMTIAGRTEKGVKISVSKGPKVSGHNPSVDVLFSSAAKKIGKKAVAVLMTGMGRDGADGMLMLKNVGAHTMIQDEKSCVVYGMPRAAEILSAQKEIVPLTKIARHVFINLQHPVKTKEVS